MLKPSFKWHPQIHSCIIHMTQVQKEEVGEITVTAERFDYVFGKTTVEAAIAAVQRGEVIVVVDDEGRENEGDLILAAGM